MSIGTLHLPKFHRMLWFLALLLSGCAAPPPQPDPRTIPPDQLTGRIVTAKIDLPLRRGMLITSDGAIDFAVYRDKMSALGPSIRRFEQARINGMESEGNRLGIRLNGSGRGDIFHKGHLRWVQPSELNSLGATVFIEFPHPPDAADMRPENIAYILRDVLDIQGVNLGPAATADTAKPTLSSAPEPEASLVSVEVEPNRVAPGESLDLIVHFEVKGATSQAPLNISIERQLYLGSTPLFSAPQVQQGFWASGIHTAHYELVVPQSTASGLYRFEAGLRVGDDLDRRDSLFEVRAVQ